MKAEILVPYAIANTCGLSSQKLSYWGSETNKVSSTNLKGRQFCTTEHFIDGLISKLGSDFR
jgi:hypothetical protein